MNLEKVTHESTTLNSSLVISENDQNKVKVLKVEKIKH